MTIAVASPTKRFFVEMLTRDIEVSDAILDLLDNCVDGVLRSRAAQPSEGVYQSRYFAALTLSEERFVIEDNCGGIPMGIAQEYAFRFGREVGDTRDNDVKTIGMYGIGMKRAIFKLGRGGTVTSKQGTDSYDVVIPPTWHQTPESWEFPIRESVAPLPQDGTRIEIVDLHPGVRQLLSDQYFRSDLVKAIWQHFSEFLAGGFRVTINDHQVEPQPLRLLYDPAGVKPFYFTGTWAGVQIDLAVGLNGPPGASEEEEEHEDHFGAERALDHAGWTIVCNARPILYGDKTRISCWGDGAPRFHPQFAVISGVVEFTSEDPSLLPVTTTKRGVDMSSPLYLATRVVMREAMTIFTRHTNQWKNHKRAEQEGYYRDAVFLPFREVFSRMRGLQLRERADPIVGGVFSPDRSGQPLPKPPTGREKRRRITFSRPDEQVRKLARVLFEDEDTPPGAVGEYCFDSILQRCEGEQQL